MFQILTMTQARLSTLTPRSEKHGDDEKPAVSLGIEIEAANTILDTIDPTLREALFKATDDQANLPGIDPGTPVLRCNSIDSVTLPTSHEGWTLAVDDGIDDTQPMTFGGCKVDKFRVEPKQGGSIVLRLRVGTGDIDAARMGMLGMHVGQPIWITLTAPAKRADAIDGTTQAFQADHPDASDLFTAAHGPEEDEDDEGSSTDADAPVETRPGDPDHINWPFPDKRNNSMDAPPDDALPEPTRPSKRTARGQAQTKAALAAGMAATQETEAAP